MALTQDETDLIKQCLIAAVVGPYFPDWEFATLIGASREDVRAAAATWPNIPPDKLFLVSNVLLNLYGYPHGEEVRLDSGRIISSAALEHLRGRLKGRPISDNGGLE